MKTYRLSCSVISPSLNIEVEGVLEASRADWGYLGSFDGKVDVLRKAELDAALPPLSRDLVGLRGRDFFFESLEGAKEFSQFLAERKIFCELSEEEPQDWNAKWRESFHGGRVEPCWYIQPAWISETPGLEEADIVLRMNPSMGFGTGEHETTQLCLTSMGCLRKHESLRVLDFGSGSGLLSVAAAKLGWSVDAVEIDEDAIASAMDCYELNGVEELVRQHKEIPSGEKYDLVVANILSQTLLEFKSQLVESSQAPAHFLLSGILESEVNELASDYAEAIQSSFGKNPKIEIFSKNDWYLISLKL